MLEAQQIAAAHGVLSLDSPEKAIAIFLGIVDYERNRELLAQMPPSVAGPLSGPVRLDDPTSRTVYAGTSLVPAAAGSWRVFWNGPWDGAYALHTSFRTP